MGLRSHQTNSDNPNKTLQKAKKLDARSKVGMLVGYSSNSKYRIWIPDENQVVISTNVIFRRVLHQTLKAERPTSHRRKDTSLLFY